jgi:hypothetical protein
MSDRPILITILALLYFASGAVILLLGLGIIALGSVLQNVSVQNILMVLEVASNGLLTIAYGLGVLAIFLGLFHIAIGYGLWKMQKWTLYVVSALLVLGMLTQLAMILRAWFAILGLLWNCFVLWYLWKNRELFEGQGQL